MSSFHLLVFSIHDDGVINFCSARETLERRVTTIHWTKALQRRKEKAWNWPRAFQICRLLMTILARIYIFFTFASPQQFIDKFESFDKFQIESLDETHWFFNLFFFASLFSGLGILPILKELKWVFRVNFKIACIMYYSGPRKDCKKLSSFNDYGDMELSFEIRYFSWFFHVHAQ